MEYFLQGNTVQATHNSDGLEGYLTEGRHKKTCSDTAVTFSNLQGALELWLSITFVQRTFFRIVIFIFFLRVLVRMTHKPKTHKHIEKEAYMYILEILRS